MPHISKGGMGTWVGWRNDGGGGQNAGHLIISTTSAAKKGSLAEFTEKNTLPRKSSTLNQSLVQ